MKVIFLKDVPRVGQKDTIKEVGDGYARNFLIAKGLAVAADEAKIRELNNRLQKRNAEKEGHDSKIVEELRRVSMQEVRIKAAANDKGVLFKKIDPKDVISALNSAKYEIDDEKVLKGFQPIKSTGTHVVTLEYGKSKSTFNLIIEKA